jgi:uncharacterized protein (TIGR03086 family)
MAIDTLEEAQRAAKSVLSRGSKDQLAISSPCAEWDVAAVIDHLVGSQYSFLQAISVAKPADAAAEASSGDYRAAFDEVAGSVMDALSADGFESSSVDLPFGTFTGAQFVDFVGLETLAHSWDVAKATSQNTDLAPDAAAHLLEVAQATMGVDRVENSNFGSVQPCAPDAPAADRLAAFLGRRVD